jgi:adenosine deaminase
MLISMLARAALRRPIFAALLTLAPALHAAPAAAQASAEERTARYMESVRERVPLLTAFLRDMPKGADLHSHLSGAVYAESYIRWAAEDGGCIVVRSLTMASPPCTPSGDSVVAATQAMSNPALWGSLVDAWSMRNWNAARENGHDQFFDTFGKFGAIDRRVGDDAGRGGRPRGRRARELPGADADHRRPRRPQPGAPGAG